MKARVYVLFLLVVFLSACAGVIKVDPTTFNLDPVEKEGIPQVCKKMYETAIPRVAVVNFQNNTTFDYAQMVQSSVQSAGQQTSRGGVGAAERRGAVGLAWSAEQKARFEANAQQISRDVNAKLSESIEDGVVNEIVNLGGAQIFSRSEMQKVMQEQQFQQSGLTDDTTLAKLGKLAGVKYIITGSVNNVNLSYVDLTETKKSAKELGGQSLLGQIIGAVAATGMETREGWNIDTEVTMRIIDVETGEIVLSKRVTGKEIIGKLPYPSYDAMVGGIKKSAAKGLVTARTELSKFFILKGYIFQTKTKPNGKQRIALINIGESQGLKSGAKLFTYTFQEVTDPIKGEASCDKVKLPVELSVTDQLQLDKAWVIIQGDLNNVKRVKVGQLVERAPVAGR